MAITHSLVATDWTITGLDIRYIGHDHNGADPSYATVIEFHRWLGGLADDAAPASIDDDLYIPKLLPSTRSTDNIITLINGYNIDATAAEHLYDGSIIQSAGDEIWDGIVNFGNANNQIQVIQDGSVISDDYWNYNIGAAASGGSATTLVDTGIGWTANQWVGYTVKNTTDGCWGRATSNTTDTITFTTGELHGGTLDTFTAADNYLIGKPLNPNTTQGISHRFMIKVREDGVDIDGRRLIGTCRRMGNTYSEFKINGTSRGNNVLALTDAGDLNCTTANTTVVGSTWDTDFSGEDAGFSTQDVNSDGTDEEYYGLYTWINTHDVNDLYERVKGETEDGSGYTVHGLPGEVVRGINYSFLYDTETGGISISDYDMLVWGTAVVTGAVSGGPFTVGEAVHEDTATPVWKGRVLAVDATNTTIIVDVETGTVGTGEGITGQSSSATATTSDTPTAVTGGGVLHVMANDTTDTLLYVQVLKGTMAIDEALLYYGGTNLATTDTLDYVAVEDSGTAITSRTISTPIIGVSTGTAIIGSYGFGIAKAKLANTDKVFDLADTAITPPNTVTNTVTGLSSGEDYILVVPWDGSTLDVNGDPEIDTDQMTLATALTAVDESTVEVNAIPGSTPDSGTLRVVNDEGFHIRVAYDSYVDATDIFTLDTTYVFNGSGLTDTAQIGNHCYVSYIDKVAAAGSENFQAVWDEDLDLVLVVRWGGTEPIKEYKVGWSFINSSQSTGAIRTTDA